MPESEIGKFWLVQTAVPPVETRLLVCRIAPLVGSSCRISIAWGGAHEGMQLYSQDAVQTLDHSGAKISFGGNDQLELGSNSLIVVTRVNPNDDSDSMSISIMMRLDPSFPSRGPQRANAKELRAQTRGATRENVGSAPVLRREGFQIATWIVASERQVRRLPTGGWAQF